MSSFFTMNDVTQAQYPVHVLDSEHPGGGSQWVPVLDLEAAGRSSNLSATAGVIRLDESLTSAHHKAVLVLPFLFLIGGPSNVINMAVFFRLGLRERINLLLFALSFTDLVYLLDVMLLYAEKILAQLNATVVRDGQLAAFMWTYKLIGLHGFCWGSQFLSAVIASERCLCILSPMKAKAALSTRSMAIIIIAVITVIVGLYFVVVLRYDIVHVLDPTTNTTSVRVSHTSPFYRAHTLLVNTLANLVYGVALPVVFTTVVTVTTAITVFKIRQTVVWRTKSTSSSSSFNNVTSAAREMALTRMLIVTSGLFVVCYIPVILFRLTALFLPDLNFGRRYHNTFRLMISVNEMFTFLNSSFNFFVYVSVGSRYRRALWRLLPCPSISNLVKSNKTQWEDSATHTVQLTTVRP